MPTNNVNDPITDQEKAFVHLILAGTMTDRQAAEAVRLNDTADYFKSKPCVSAYMLEHRFPVQQASVEPDAEELHRFNQSRDRVLARLWQIADLPPEMTRNGMSAQVKALSMIIAIERLIPDRRAASTPNKPSPEPATPPFYVAEWMRNQQNGETADSQSAPNGEEDQPHPAPDPTPAELSSQPELLRSAVEESAGPAPLNPSQATSPMPRVPMADNFAPDTRRPFTIDKNRFGRRR
jgi:hypothetical protein